MAANYWASSQRLHWQTTKQEVQESRRRAEDETLVQQFPLPERRLLSIFINQQITKLGKRLQMRQQVLATAQLYIRRFYTKVDVRRTNPYLVLTTAVYLAGKMEESPQHIRAVALEARNLWPDFISGDTTKLGECEFFLISEMNSQLIVHHPYRTLAELQTAFQLPQEEYVIAWAVINDHYLTDLPLVCAPHVVALAAVFMALVLKPTSAATFANPSSLLASASQAVGSPGQGQGQGQGGSPAGPQSAVQRLMAALASSEVELEAVVDATQEIVSLYEIWDQYSDKVCKEQIARYVKARGLDK